MLQYTTSKTADTKGDGMSEMKIIEGSVQSLLQKESNACIVSSSFEYVPGSLNSAYIITSSAVNEPAKVEMSIRRK